MLPQRPNGSLAGTSTRKSGSIAFAQVPFEALKIRILAKLEDRFDLTSSKRMPPSLLRQSIRTHAEQVTDQELRGVARPDRERLIEEVLAELLGYGPLDALFRDPTVREIMVTGPNSVIVRKEQGQWLPTSVKYRDEEHLRWTLDKLATHADPIGGTLPSVNLFDFQLPNGFRAMAIIPPPALGASATVALIRSDPSPTLAVDPPAMSQHRSQPSPSASTNNLKPQPPLTASASAATQRPVPGSIIASPRPGSGPINTPPPRFSPGDSVATAGIDPLARHRNKIIERLISKLASLGVYDLQRLEITEFRKVVTAYVREYVEVEKIYMSETDQCKLMLEILAAMQR